jgi:CubicO group peptidase (beta-lactamase class C family)
MFLRLTVAALGFASAAVPAAAQTSRARQIALMDSIAESPVLEGRVAGLAVAVVRGTDTLLLKSYGMADLEWRIPMPVDAVFEIGSVTKQFTAAAILKLRDAGKIDLDADLSRYLPDFNTQGHRIPVRRLLDHTSGMKGATEMASFGTINTQNLPRDTLLDLIGAEPFDFTPGEALIYNNSAYIVLGHIIEKVSGGSYEAYVETELFGKLGMARSSYCSNTDVVPRKARGYRLTPAGLVQGAYTNHLWPYSAGSLCSTVGDLVTWLRALHGGRVLPAASYRDLITPAPLTDGTPVRYAMGLGLADPRGRPAIGHGGAIGSGFVSHTMYYPGDDLVVVMLVNTAGNLSPAALATEMVDVLLPRPARETRPFTGDAAPLLGTYTGPSRGRPMTVTVSLTGTGLAVAMGGDGPGERSALGWIDGWTFSTGPTQTIIFERAGPDGPATVMRLDGTASHYVLRRKTQ